MKEVQLKEAVEVLQRGDILLYPTETLYGLGVDIQNEAALEKLFKLKGRAGGKAFSLLVAGPTSLKSLVKELDSNTLKLIDNFLPGPLTLVVQAGAGISPKLTENGQVGIRWSSHPLAQKLVTEFGRSITTTSANPSGEESGRTLDQLKKYFGDREDVFLLSGGDLPPSPGSTVVQVEGGSLKLLREGEIKFTEIEKVWAL